MANRKISELPAAGALSGAELVEAVQGGVNVQTTAQAIADLGGGGGETSGPLSRTETGTTLTVDDDDHNYIITLTNAAGVAVTLPNTVSDGVYVTFIRAVGAGVITFIEGGTSVFNTLGDEVTIDEEKAWASWKKDGATEWYGAGGLGPLGTGGGGGGGTWGSIIGTLGDQTDLAAALAAKANNYVSPTTKTANYTLAAGDLASVQAGATLSFLMNVATANDFNIPTNATVAFPTGTVMWITQYGAGQTTIVPAGGVTLRSALNANKTYTQYSVLRLSKIGTDEWLLTGDMTP